MIGHHLDEFTGVEVALDVVGGDLDEAEAGKATSDVGLGAVDRDPTAHRQQTYFAIINPLPILDPACRRGCVIDGQMRNQILGAPWRAMSSEITGAGDIDQRQVADLAGNQAGVAKRSDTQHAVDAVLHQVDGAVGDAQVNIELGMVLKEMRQGRRDDQAADPPGHIDPQLAGRPDGGLPEQPFRLIDIGDQPQAAFIKGGAVLGRRNLSGSAVKQARTNPRFELDHGGGDGRTWNPERIGSTGEARAFDDTGEGAEEIDTVQGMASM